MTSDARGTRTTVSARNFMTNHALPTANSTLMLRSTAVEQKDAPSDAAPCAYSVDTMYSPGNVVILGSHSSVVQSAHAQG